MKIFNRMWQQYKNISKETFEEKLKKLRIILKNLERISEYLCRVYHDITSFKESAFIDVLP